MKSNEKHLSWLVVIATIALIFLFLWAVLCEGSSQVTVSWHVTLKDITDGWLRYRMNTIADYDQNHTINFVDYARFAAGYKNKRIVSSDWWLCNQVYYPDGMTTTDKQRLWQQRRKLQTSGVPGDINYDGRCDWRDFAWLTNRKDLTWTWGD